MLIQHLKGLSTLCWLLSERYVNLIDKTLTNCQYFCLLLLFSYPLRFLPGQPFRGSLSHTGLITHHTPKHSLVLNSWITVLLRPCTTPNFFYKLHVSAAIRCHFSLVLHYPVLFFIPVFYIQVRPYQLQFSFVSKVFQNRPTHSFFAASKHAN